ncbi:MAG: hypothetical protein K2I06_10120 [Ruminococcus sp.]|nr:hypothetical protein [Ruminococcus sp.]
MEDKKKNFKPLIIVIVIILVCIGILFGLFFYRNHSRKEPVKTINSFMYALNHNNINGMLDCIEPTESELIKSGLEKIDEITDSEIAEKLTDYLPFLTAYLKVDLFPKEFDVKIIKTEVDGKKAVVTVSIIDSKIYYDIYLIKLDGKWYIQYASKSD